MLDNTAFPAFGRSIIEPSLAWLLQPLTVQTFLDEIWGATQHHVKRCCAGYFDGLLPGSSGIDELVNLFRHEPSAVRLVRGNDQKMGPNSYRLIDGRLDVDSVRNDFANGYTIVLDGVERHVRAIATLSHSIEVELNFPVKVNVYITPPVSQGLIPHYDTHDVLVLQVLGSKIWHLYDGVVVPPREIERNKNKVVAVDDLLTPTDLRLDAGDVLYFPRGRFHAAETTSEPSIHLTVAMHPPTLLMLAIGALRSHSFNDDRLNAQLPPRYLDDADVPAALGDLVRDGFQAAGDPKAIAEVLAAFADDLVRRGKCPPVSPISHFGIDGQTLVRKYQPLYARVWAVDGGVSLQFASSSVRVGADHETALRFIAKSTEPFRVSELPELAIHQQIELVRSLIVSGFLVRLPDD
ncbi:cupin superfamily protein [Mycobacterium numidiamassiliense]|uniref:Cupin superfamily protein n=1 Tax=Mycobacterium numidiamassiliense TaxID=1841861 RepID=A0A2U3P5L9_9MYCO|nr:cupin domain-containing protein [Mycobacterium numidiamassiliense]SPM39062.1 cupin superfamily protein [Mycobacterium numidiamassiliense]